MMHALQVTSNPASMLSRRQYQMQQSHDEQEFTDWRGAHPDVEASDDTEDILQDLFAPSRSRATAFEKVMSSSENMQRWEPFIEITEEEEAYMLAQIENAEKANFTDPSPNSYPPSSFTSSSSLSSSSSSSSYRARVRVIHIDTESPASKFSRVDRRIRHDLLRRHADPFIRQIEQELIRFIQRKSRRPLVLHLEDGFQRLLTHGCCQYMCLSSQSVTDPASGLRVTVISAPRGVDLPVPRVLLTEYLASLHKIGGAS